MINVKVKVPAEPAECDTMARLSGQLLRPMIAKDVEGIIHIRHPDWVGRYILRTDESTDFQP